MKKPQIPTDRIQKTLSQSPTQPTMWRQIKQNPCGFSFFPIKPYSLSLLDLKTQIWVEACLEHKTHLQNPETRKDLQPSQLEIASFDRKSAHSSREHVVHIHTEERERERDLERRKLCMYLNSKIQFGTHELGFRSGPLWGYSSLSSVSKHFLFW